MNPSMKSVIAASRKACTSFAEVSGNFFNFEKRPGWLGWENWLTVEIIRRLNHKHVVPFLSYPCGGGPAQRLDIYVDVKPAPLAVEIKVNYIARSETTGLTHRPLPDRVFKDAKKLASLDKGVRKLIMVSTCFETRDSLKIYGKLVEHDLDKRFKNFPYRWWYDCSNGSGNNLLLAMSNSKHLDH